MCDLNQKYAISIEWKNIFVVFIRVDTEFSKSYLTRVNSKWKSEWIQNIYD